MTNDLVFHDDDDDGAYVNSHLKNIIKGQIEIEGYQCDNAIIDIDHDIAVENGLVNDNIIDIEVPEMIRH